MKKLVGSGKPWAFSPQIGALPPQFTTRGFSIHNSGLKCKGKLCLPAAEKAVNFSCFGRIFQLSKTSVRPTSREKTGKHKILCLPVLKTTKCSAIVRCGEIQRKFLCIFHKGNRGAVYCALFSPFWLALSCWRCSCMISWLAARKRARDSCTSVSAA